MEGLIQDLRYGFRMFLKHPAMIAAAIISLGLGIGANTAVFSVINAVLLRGLPYKDADRLVVLWQSNPQKGWFENPVSYPNYADWETENQVFESIGAYCSYYDFTFNLTDGNHPDAVQAAMVTASFFPMLGVEPIRGRVFTKEEDEPGGDRVVLLGEGLWKRRYGGDQNLVGNTISLNGQNFTVIGIMPSYFRVTEEAELWITTAQDPIQGRSYSRGTRYLVAMGRLKPGVTFEQAQTDMQRIARQQEEENPRFNANLSIKVVSLRDQVIGNVRIVLLVLLGAAAFVLFITCANVANLLLVRAANRQKEIALRVAVGASRIRIFRQLLTESVLLAVLGGVLGMLLAFWTVSLLTAGGSGLPRVDEVNVDGRVLGFSVLISLITGVIFGLAPALQASKPDLNESLKESSTRSTEGFRKHRVRSLLVVSEIALALMLLIGAGLMLKSFQRLQDISPGFNPENVLTAELYLPRAKYAQDQEVSRFYGQVLERLSATQGVESAGIISILPMGGGDANTGFFIEGRPMPGPGETIHTHYRSISQDYFKAMGISLIRGRYFNRDDNSQSPKVAIINETMAQRFWPGEDPIGKRLAFDFEAMKFDMQKGMQVNIPENSREVVGVVRDVKHSTLDGESKPETYVPYLQLPLLNMALVVKTRSNPTDMITTTRSQVSAIDAEQPLYKIRTMSEVVLGSFAQQRFRTFLLGVFALVALLLAGVGVYGVISYSVTQRTHEIGIRMALGALPKDILILVVGQGARLVAIGVIVGLAGAFALGRAMSSLLYGVGGSDPLTFAAGPLLLGAIALIASYIPARKATKVEPMTAFRIE